MAQFKITQSDMKLISGRPENVDMGMSYVRNL